MAEPCPPANHITRIIETCDAANQELAHVVAALGANTTAKIVLLRVKMAATTVRTEEEMLVSTIDANRIAVVCNRRVSIGVLNYLYQFYPAEPLSRADDRRELPVREACFGGRQFKFFARTHLCHPMGSEEPMRFPLPYVKDTAAVQRMFDSVDVVYMHMYDVKDLNLFDEIDAATTHCRFVLLDHRMNTRLDPLSQDEGTIVETGKYEARWYTKCPRSMRDTRPPPTVVNTA